MPQLLDDPNGAHMVVEDLASLGHERIARIHFTKGFIT